MRGSDSDVDETLSRQAIRYLREHGAPIELISEAEATGLEIEGQPVSASQAILKAYAAGMADAVQLEEA